MKQILSLEYHGLRKIISGGQVGADRGGLEAGNKWPIETGGWAPKGWRTQYGPAPELAEFGLVEHHRSEYKYRTEKNIEDADGTLIVASRTSSPGTALTISMCVFTKKPFYVMKPEYPLGEISIVADWVELNGIEVLNVAGNRDTADRPAYHHAAAESAVTLLLHELQKRGKLNIGKV